MDSEFGLFGGGWQDYRDRNIKPVLDELDRRIADIQVNGMEGQLARMQAQDVALGVASGKMVGTAVPRGGDSVLIPLAGPPRGYGDDPNLPPAHLDIGASPSPQIMPPSAVLMGSSSDPLIANQNGATARAVGPDGPGADGGGVLEKARRIYDDVSGFLTSPEFTEPLRRQGQYVNRAGDIVGLGGRGLAVAGAVTAQPELAAPGLAGMGVGEVLNLLGNIGIVASDILANDRNAAARDSVGAGVSGALPPTVDPQPIIDKTAGYYGY